MKLRIQGNSVRFRLTQTEVKNLSEGNPVYEKTEFGEVDFGYRVRVNREWEAQFSQGLISISVPESLVKDWADTDQVSLHFVMESDKGNDLEILVEKDFKCLVDRPGEKDNFPHPKAGELEC